MVNMHHQQAEPELIGRIRDLQRVQHEPRARDADVLYKTARRISAAVEVGPLIMVPAYFQSVHLSHSPHELEGTISAYAGLLKLVGAFNQQYGLGVPGV